MLELFEQLIERNASEPQIQSFFEQNPAFLMQARMAIPIPHQPNFAKPANNKPDFAFSPILGPVDDTPIELLELKLPGEKTLNKGFHRGLAAKVHRAIDQLKDYARYPGTGGDTVATYGEEWHPQGGGSYSGVNSQGIADIPPHQAKTGLAGDRGDRA